MPVVDASIEIDVPAAQLWDLATRPETALVTSSNLTAFSRTNRDDDGPAQAGDEVKGVSRVAGKSIEWTARVNEAEPGTSLAVESIESQIDFVFRYDYSDLGDGRTRIDFHQESPEYGGMFGKLADAIVTRMYQKDVQSNLAALKEYAEAQ